MSDTEWIDQLTECPTPDRSHYPVVPAEADAIYQQAKAADEAVPRVMPMEKIVAMYQQAAELNHLGAMYNLAVSYYEGTGVAQDNAKARYWLERIASFDTPEGYTGLAMMYRKGIGVPPSNRRAREYMVLAAQKGDRDALYYFGRMVLDMRLLFRGDDSASADKRKELRRKGMKLLECAAKQGHRDAHFSLAIVYDNTEQTHLAYKWLRLGAKAGSGACIRSLADGYKRWKTWVQLNLMEDKERAKCLRKLDDELDKNPNLTFPDLDERCPPNVAQPNVRDDPFPPPEKW